MIPRCPDPAWTARLARGLALLLLLVCLFAGGLRWATAAPAEIYVYREQGRPVYVNGLERVPPAYRQGAKRVDLSQISLNPELGQELSQQLAREVAQLEQARAAAARAGSCAAAPEPGLLGWGAWAWQQHGYVILLAGLALILLIAAPFIARRIGAAPTVRVLMIVLPLLLFLGLVTFAVSQTASALRTARGCQKLEQAARPAQQAPAARQQLQQLLHELGGGQAQPERR